MSKLRFIFLQACLFLVSGTAMSQTQYETRMGCAEVHIGELGKDVCFNVKVPVKYDDEGQPLYNGDVIINGKDSEVFGGLTQDYTASGKMHVTNGKISGPVTLNYTTNTKLRYEGHLYTATITYSFKGSYADGKPVGSWTETKKCVSNDQKSQPSYTYVRTFVFKDGALQSCKQTNSLIKDTITWSEKNGYSQKKFTSLYASSPQRIKNGVVDGDTNLFKVQKYWAEGNDQMALFTMIDARKICIEDEATCRLLPNDGATELLKIFDNNFDPVFVREKIVVMTKEISRFLSSNQIFEMIDEMTANNDCQSLTMFGKRLLETHQCDRSNHDMYYYVTSSTVNKVKDRLIEAMRKCNADESLLNVLSRHTEGDLTYSDATKTHLVGCAKTATSVIVPNSVTSIDEKAFYGCSSLTSITIPNTVTSIGKYAFCGCSGLTSVNIPASVTEIDEGVFEYCTILSSVSIPNSVTKIGSWVFDSCISLTNIAIPNSVTSIGRNAFCNCSSLEQVVIPNPVSIIDTAVFLSCTKLANVTIGSSVTSISPGAFYGCSSLTSITIPNSVTTIGDGAFLNCSGLTSLTIPNSVTNIGQSAFDSCSSLSSVIIPNSVTLIGANAFNNCSGLTSITSEANNAPTLGVDAFGNIPSDVPVNIPLGSKASYISNWSCFSNFVEVSR